MDSGFESVQPNRIVSSGVSVELMVLFRATAIRCHRGLQTATMIGVKGRAFERANI